tara:strand:+ start:181 stop:435 length:255 start_codon:yes stop_codon:yes gene_type:complete
MSWKDIVKEAECKIEVCSATKCKHNQNLKCTLSKVNISDNGSCLMYSENPASPSLSDTPPAKTRGHDSFIARAKKNLDEEKRNR